MSNYPPVSAFGAPPPTSDQQQPGYPPMGGAPGMSYPPAQQQQQQYPGAYPAQPQQQAYPMLSAPGYPGSAPSGYPGAATPPAPAGYPGMHSSPAPAAPSGYPGAHAAHAAPAAGAGARVVVVGANYCMPQQMTLKATEAAWSASGDDFDIVDAQSGRKLFKMDAKSFSMRERRTLLDCATGRPACGLMKKPLSMSGAWLMYSGGDFTHKVCEIKPKMMTLKPYVYVFLNDGDKEPDFSVKGNFLSKQFDVFSKANGGKALVARVKKESKFSNAQAYAHSQFYNKQAYFITAEPGVDIAFLSALCTVIDEIFHDQQN